MIQTAIRTLIEKKHLSRQQAYESVLAIMSGKVSEPLISSFLTALRMKGETGSEITGAVQAMREVSTKISTKHQNIIDTCGTGGDGLGTFNISTVSAIVASAAGAIVAKHGNRAISSKCGSADILKALGVNIDIPKEKVGQCLDEIGIAFLFAPLLHNAMKYAAPVRRELGFRTIFNILGPLTNPASAARQVVGVFNSALTEVLAQVLQELGTERALIVHGVDGIDEISTIGETKISEIRNNKINSYMFNCEDAGIKKTELKGILGGDVETNVSIVHSILNGNNGTAKDIVILNAGAALYIADKADSIKNGVSIARETIDSGKAKKKLSELIEFSNS
jgi:anthranilate phosphoribosyltransferase